MLFQHQPADGAVFFSAGKESAAIGGGGLPGKFEVIPIAYTVVETVSLIALLFQH